LAARQRLAHRRASQTWAMLIRRVYEIDPLECPKCGGQMKVVAFIERPGVPGASKSEFRNPKRIRNPRTEKLKTICIIRISNFGFV
jgi:hypothetical protein